LSDAAINCARSVRGLCWWWCNWCKRLKKCAMYCSLTHIAYCHECVMILMMIHWWPCLLVALRERFMVASRKFVMV